MLVKFRAECEIDVQRLLELIPDNHIVGLFIEASSAEKLLKMSLPDKVIALDLINFSMKKLKDLIDTI